MTIENNVRIDDFAVMSGKISMGDFVHVDRTHLASMHDSETMADQLDEFIERMQTL